MANDARDVRMVEDELYPMAELPVEWGLEGSAKR